ncbi:MAG TPA: hypothetical protein VK947_10725 [Planococcus sp. (in: firmicutes)]|nr:hypothetical protein [Planococcus sp. (in: firmicutes)]
MNITQNNGFESLDFIEIKEEDIKEYAPVAGSFTGRAVKLEPFLKNDETSKMKLWDRSGTLGVIDKMDLKILDFV